MTDQCHARCDDECSEQHLRRRSIGKEVDDRGNENQDGQLNRMENSVERDQACQSACGAEKASSRRTDLFCIAHL